MTFDEILEKMDEQMMWEAKILLSVSVKRGMYEVQEEIKEFLKKEKLRAICTPEEFMQAFFTEHSIHIKGEIK